MQITGSLHLTATEKKHIKAIIAKGWTEGSTKVKSYKMEVTDTGFVGKVFTKERDDWGNPRTTTQNFTVTMH